MDRWRLRAFFRPRTVSKGSPSDETGGFFAAHPLLIPLVCLAVLVVLYVLWPRLKPKIEGQWRKAKQGAAIFSDWRRGRGRERRRGCSTGRTLAHNDSEHVRPCHG
jgi:hypothetical protein